MMHYANAATIHHINSQSVPHVFCSQLFVYIAQGRRAKLEKQTNRGFFRNESAG